MSEQLLKAIIQLFAIVAKEGSVTYNERLTIKEFLERQLNRSGVNKFMELFDKLVLERESERVRIENTDDETVDFVEDWSKIIRITRQLNKELTEQQKVVLILKMVELITADKIISERESNLLYYISKALKLKKKTVNNITNFVDYSQADPVVSSNLLIIDDGSIELPEELNRMVAGGLQGQLVVLRLPSVENYFIKYLGKATVYLNGVPLKNNKGVVFSTGSTIRAYRTEPIYYSDVVGKFLTDKELQKIVFKAENIYYKFPDGTLGLKDISVFEESGKLISIMGSSGSGKSTLLNVLNGNLTPSEGSVTINNVNIHQEQESIEGVIGYIPQDDFLIEELTVFDNLFFAAKLCFGKSSDRELNKLVSKTLSNLGLAEIKDLKVGSPLDKIISGGQRKRVNVGLELLREPQVLFVDEPTSGLSSRDSENIMDLLKELTLKGKLIFVVIHQPSSDIFKMFDRLVILDAGGYQIYYGNPVEAESYFKDITNLIDKDLGTCPVCGNIRPEEIFNIIETKVVNEYGRLTDKRRVSPQQWEEHFKYRSILPVVSNVNQKPEGRLDIPRRLKQFFIFTTRDVKSKLSNLQYVLINSLEAPLLGLILAFIVKEFPTEEVEYTFGKNVNIPAFFFISVIVALFMGLTVSAEEIIKDRKIIKRESFLHLSRGSYLISKITILFGISAVQTFSFALIGCLILEIKGMFFAYWLVLFSTSSFANVLGLNVSSAFKFAVTVYILIPILLIPQLILGGVVVKFDDLHPRLRSHEKVPLVGEIMTSRWAYEALVVHQFKANAYEKHFFKDDQIRSNADYKTTYYIPKLESKIAALPQLISNNHTDELQASLELLRYEIGKELEKVGTHQLPDYDRLTVENIDENVINATEEFLSTLRRYYYNQANEATERRRATSERIKKQLQNPDDLASLRIEYQNETIRDMVNNRSVDRIVEENNRLIQKIYPIYIWPEGAGLFKFRTQFLVARKPFLGTYIDTFVFNILVIWAMTALLFVLLFYDVLGRISLR
ncbi:MAG: hypothetical protein DHS20C17_12280 [Cyclobacteriaceae bacterium]|nr:MAG: hypothetical protein DHS20C17_12280 [Cyclobacteriaceae bacterium]